MRHITAVGGPLGPNRFDSLAVHLSSLLRVAMLMTATGIGCEDNPASVRKQERLGSVKVFVQGVSEGGAKVVISGPSGFVRTITGSARLTGLQEGSYQIVAEEVEVEGLAWQPSPDSQTADVLAGDTVSARIINYFRKPPSLSLEVVGLPPGGVADIWLTAPGFGRKATGSRLFTDLLPGTYTISATPVSIEGVTMYVRPAEQQVELRTGVVTHARVAYETGDLNLSVAGIYLTQAVQTFDGALPLVQGRDAMLRIFVVANRRNLARPSARVRIYHGQVLVSSEITPAMDSTVPTAVAEENVWASLNARIPGALIQPDLSVAVDVDPLDRYAESSETDNSFPAEAPRRADVRWVPPFRVRFIPVLFTANNTVGDVGVANMATYLSDTKGMFPLHEVDADVGGVFTYSGEPRFQNGSTLLSELDAKRVVEGTDRHYHGVISTGAGFGLAGLAGRMTTIAWDDPSARGHVAAHEWGHSWGRWHSPGCILNSTDPNYPYPEGNIGVSGMDVARGTAKDASSTFDVMSYCIPRWTSDYTYRAVLEYRSSSASGSATPQPNPRSSVQPVLIVWGRIRNGIPVVEPAFLVHARPQLPTKEGAFRVQGTDTTGMPIFDFSFDAVAVMDSPVDEGYFAFAVPISEVRAKSIAEIRLRVHDREISRFASTALLPAAAGSVISVKPVTLRRESRGTLRLEWDAAAHPAALVRDARTGEVLAIARNGVATLRSGASDVDVHLSNGTGSVTKRMRPANR